MKLFAVIAAILALTTAQAQRLVFSSDTIVSSPYQEFFCEGVDSLEHVCTDTLMITAEGGGSVYLDSIVFRVDTARVIITALELHHDFIANNSMSGSYGSPPPSYYETFSNGYEYEPIYEKDFKKIWIYFVGQFDSPFIMEPNLRPEFACQIEIQLLFFYETFVDTLTVIGREWCGWVQVVKYAVPLIGPKHKGCDSYKINGQFLPAKFHGSRLPVIVPVKKEE